MKLHLLISAFVLVSVLTSYSPEHVMVDITNEFGACVLKLVASRTENVAFSPYGLVSVALVVYEGASGPTAAEIHNSLRLPWDREVIRVGFRDLHRYLKSYFTNDGFLRGLVLSKADVELHKNYTKQLQFYGFDLKTETPTKPPTSVGTTTSTTQTPSQIPTTLKPVTTLSPPTIKPTTGEVPEATTMTTTVKEDATTTKIESSTVMSTETSKDVEGKDMEGDIPESGLTTEMSKTKPPLTEGTTIAITTETKKPEVQTEAETSPSVTSEVPQGGDNDVTTIDVSMVKTTVSMTVTALRPNTTPKPQTEAVTEPEPVTVAETTTVTPASETTQAAVPPETTTTPPIETTTQAPTEAATQAPTEAATQAPTEAATQAPTEAATQAPTEAATQAPTEAATQAPTEAATQAPSEATTTVQAVAETEGTTQLAAAAETDNVASESEMVTRKERALYSKGYVPLQREGIPNWVPHYQDPRWSYNAPLENWFFTPSGGERVPIITYTAYLPFAYITELAALALQLPLDDPRYYMLILLPEDREGLGNLLYALQWCSIRGIVNKLKTTAIYATVPSFTVVKHINLVPALGKLGILRIFDSMKADLSAMSPEPGLFVRTIEQVVTVSLRKYFANHRWFDATPGDVEQHFIANHPFAYFVLDKETQVALMTGTIVNPVSHNQR